MTDKWSEHTMRCSTCVLWVGIDQIVTHYLQHHPDLVPGDVQAGLGASQQAFQPADRGTVATDESDTPESGSTDRTQPTELPTELMLGSWRECPVCQHWVSADKLGMHDEMMHPDQIPRFDVGNTENPGEW